MPILNLDDLENTERKADFEVMVRVRSNSGWEAFFGTSQVVRAGIPASGAQVWLWGWAMRQ